MQLRTLLWHESGTKKATRQSVRKCPPLCQFEDFWQHSVIYSSFSVWLHGTLSEPVCYFPEKNTLFWLLNCSRPLKWSDFMSHPKISKNVIFIRLSQRYRKVLFHIKACFYCTVDIIPCGGSTTRYSTETDVVWHQRWLELLTGAKWREDFWFHLNETKGKQMKSVYILKWYFQTRWERKTARL